jgi:hypothetical protein
MGRMGTWCPGPQEYPTTSPVIPNVAWVCGYRSGGMDVLFALRVVECSRGRWPASSHANAARVIWNALVHAVWQHFVLLSCSSAV